MEIKDREKEGQRETEQEMKRERENRRETGQKMERKKKGGEREND